MSRKKKIDAIDPPSVGEQIIEGLTSLRDALRDGDDLELRFTVRKVELDLDPRAYAPADVRRVRKQLNVSQAVFAQLLGVSASTIRAWEQGDRTPSPMARRFLDEIGGDLPRWRRRLLKAATTR